jgi:hypothetical protein
MKGIACLTFILVLTMTSLIAPSVESITNPSVSEFTVKFIDSSYDVPKTTTTDPYSGQSITHAGYHVENKTIEVRIKNQPFTRYAADSQIIDCYLNMRTKGHYEQNWTDTFHLYDIYPNQTDGDYTVLSFSYIPDFQAFFISNPEYYSYHNGFSAPSSSGQIDFQVEAMIGSIHRDGSQFMAPWVFDGQTSGWSSTQTLTIPASESTATQNPSVSPATSSIPTAATGAQGSVLFGLDWLQVTVVALLGVVAVLLVFVVVYLRRRSVG